MVTIEAYMRKRKSKAGLCPLNIRITKNRKSSYIQIGQRIDPKYWDPIRRKVKKNHPNSTRLNNLISSKLVEINKSLLDIESGTKPITQAAEIKKTISGKHKSHSFYTFAETYFIELEKNKKFSRINSERPLLNRIKEYPRAKDLTFQDVTPLFLRAFISYLRSNKDSIGERSIVNTLIFIRTLYNRASQQNIISKENYPFGNNDGKIKIKIPQSIKIGLTAVEIKSIESLDLSEHPKQHHSRNVFLFSFYLAGMRVADVLKITWANIQGERIYYTMNKNQKNLSLKIHDKLQNILDEYEADKASHTDFIFPELKEATKDPKDILRVTKIANKRLNRYLGQITEKAEIKTKITMHVARHSFGNISGDKIPLQVLQKLYNHSDIKTTIQYQQNFMNKDLDDALDSVVNG
ncbi:site-specific integrase [Flagellimonas pacifica]|uniref:Site-specific recombinase XerD n=1 Tax=Flagellimonas pacifica TaxID=1247520 RepID=A0A285MXA2_9FLAO|nr:site-specific integrase [Allomuricauda parva]SNZ01177.1 Site-specific recombinase XerD [Allomuricauda parva]